MQGVSTEETLIGGASRELLSPENLRQPGLREAAMTAALGNGHTGEREFPFLMFWRKCFSQTGSTMSAKC